WRGAVLARGGALFFVSRKTMSMGAAITGSLLMGAAIAAMHYIGMEAMRLPAMCAYNSGIVLLSVALAIVISFVALWLTFAFRGDDSKRRVLRAGSGLLMGLAIPVMPYVGMAAVSFMPAPERAEDLVHAIRMSDLGIVGITLISVTLLG